MMSSVVILLFQYRSECVVLFHSILSMGHLVYLFHRRVFQLRLLLNKLRSQLVLIQLVFDNPTLLDYLFFHRIFLICLVVVFVI